ncbi:MAG TPA: hypothetical protein VMU95_12050 [Trebonia sp.]|nr:hypothetical protein [Trebonia sp.]
MAGAFRPGPFLAAATLDCNASVRSTTFVAAGASSADWNSSLFFLASISSLTRSV